MRTNPAPGAALPARPAALAAAMVFLAVCLGPYLARLRSPSLYADDVVRVAQLQTVTLGGLLFVPCNEHIAPLFQVVSWLAWRLAGRQLAWAPLAFTMASFLPFVPTLGLIAWVVRRETRSGTAALGSVAVFSLSWLHVETVYWYSASSFQWALLATLAGWIATAAAADADPGGGRGRGGWLWVVAALAAAAAPAFSAIGLLAGPVAAVRALAAPGGRRRVALAPLAGTLFALGLYGAMHDRSALATDVVRNSGVAPGLLAAARAPAAALVPALAGVRTWEATSPVVAVVQVALSTAAAAVLLLRAYQGHDRPLTLGGLLLVFGGYVLTFCPRAGEPGRAVLEIQRYHLFPMLGLVMLLAPFLRRALGRWDARPVDSLRAATALAVVLLALHQTEMRGRARFIRYPDQAHTLAAIDRLGVVCGRSKITRAQALAALDPVETAWTPPGHNALILLAPGVETSGVADLLVKPTLLASLTPDERRSVCGGMDATPYLRPDVGPSTAVAVGRRVALYRVTDAGTRRYVAAGWPSYIEYELSGPTPTGARALGLDGTDPSGVVEVWWRGDRQRWSETRSVRLHPRPVPDPARPQHSWRLPLDQLPHWDPREARRVRLLYHAAGPVAVSAPKLIR